jgi:hypothetical protein
MSSLHNTFDRWRFSNSGDPGPLEYRVRCSDFENQGRRKLAVTKSDLSARSMILAKTSKRSVSTGDSGAGSALYYRTGMDARPEEFPGPKYEARFDLSKERERNRPKTSRTDFGTTRRFHSSAPECNFRLGPGTYDRPSTMNSTVDPYMKTSFTNTVRVHPADLDSRRLYPGPGMFSMFVALFLRILCTNTHTHSHIHRLLQSQNGYSNSFRY